MQYYLLDRLLQEQIDQELGVEAVLSHLQVEEELLACAYAAGYEGEDQ